MSSSEISSEDLARIIMKNPFPQTSLQDEGRFLRFLEERGIRIRLENLEWFEEMALLYPIVRIIRPTYPWKKVRRIENGVTKEYLQPLERGEAYDGEIVEKYGAIGNVTYGLENYFNQNLVVFPSKEFFKPWKEYRKGYEETAFAYYHTYQVIQVKEIMSSVTFSVWYKAFLSKEGKEPNLENLNKIYEVKLKILPGKLKDFQKLIRLLLLIQDRYLPFIRKRFVGNGFAFTNSWEKWFDWRDKFDPQAVLEQSNYTIEEIKNWRRYFAAQARFIDPLKQWFIIIRHISYAKREKLKGNALLAQDYYEIVDLLGEFLFDLTGETQPDADDLFDARHGSWKKEWYGQERLDYENHEVLKRVLDEYGINPKDKLLLILEGPTENEAVPIIARAMQIDFEKLGIRIMPLGGVGEASPERCQKLLEYLALSSSFPVPYIILDNDEQVREILKKYKSKLVNPNNYRIWDAEFEQDNFTEDEIIVAVKKQAEKRGFNDIQISVELIEKERQAKKDEGKAVPYLTKILGKILHPYEIDKPELGRDLGEMVAARISKQLEEQKYVPLTEIEQEIIKIVKLANTV